MAELAAPTATALHAVALRDGFLAYNAAFRAITQRAKPRFEQRDWLGSQRDAEDRIDLWDQHIHRETQRMAKTLAHRLMDRELWAGIKSDFARTIADLPDAEFAKTYFSSVARKIFNIVGRDPDIEFVDEENIPLRNTDGPLIGRNYTQKGSLEQMFRTMLDDYAWDVPFAHPDQCAAYIATQVTEHYREKQKSPTRCCAST